MAVVTSIWHILTLGVHPPGVPLQTRSGMSSSSVPWRPWMPLRVTQMALVAAVALFATLVAFNNLTDYSTNYAFVQHVLRMDTIFPDSTLRYRSIQSSGLHHAFYALIIATEMLVAVLCWWGAWRLWRQRWAAPLEFRQAKGVAVVGLLLGMLLWLTGFLTIGSEWFGMWMSSTWNGGETASRFLAVFMGAFLVLVVRDD